MTVMIIRVMCRVLMLRNTNTPVARMTVADYVERTPLLKELAGAIRGVLNGQLADEINAVSMQRYGKMIATVQNYFPLRTDDYDPGKKYENAFEGENIFTDSRLKSRGFTKQRVFSENALGICPGGWFF